MHVAMFQPRLVQGAADMRQVCRSDDIRANPAHLYAATRYALYERGFQTEVLATFHSGLATIGEWWKQLYGESEGKDGKGIFPASTVYTTDLHSLGQYVQDGRRDLLHNGSAACGGTNTANCMSQWLTEEACR